MFERQWTAVSNQFFTVNGGADGAVTLASTAGFFVKMIVKVSSLTQPTLLLEVKRVISPTLLYVGPTKDKIGTRTDISTYTVADLATIGAAQQDRSGITQADYERFVIAEEPILGKRVIWVDEWGRYYGSPSNPVNVIGGGGGAASGAANLTIVNPIAAIANTEYSISIPVGTQKIRVRNKDTGRIQYSFIASQTSTNFMTIFPGVTEDIGDLMLTSGSTFYFRCLKDNQTLEVMIWN